MFLADCVQRLAAGGISGTPDALLCYGPGGQRRGARECIFHLSLPYLSPSSLSVFGAVSLLLLTEVILLKSVIQHFRKELCFCSLAALAVSTKTGRYDTGRKLAPTSRLLRGLMSQARLLGLLAAWQQFGMQRQEWGIAESLGTVREFRK